MDIVEAGGRGVAVQLESVRKVYGRASNGAEVVALPD
jgi:hypothetical protein